MEVYPIRFTDEQVAAVEDAFTDSALTFSDKLRLLVAEALAARGVTFPASPTHGGKRQGSGRRKRGGLTSMI